MMDFDSLQRAYDSQDDDWQYEPLTAEQMAEIAENEAVRRMEDE